MTDSLVIFTHGHLQPPKWNAGRFTCVGGWVVGAANFVLETVSSLAWAFEPLLPQNSVVFSSGILLGSHVVSMSDPLGSKWLYDERFEIFFDLFFVLRDTSYIFAQEPLWFPGAIHYGRRCPLSAQRPQHCWDEMSGGWQTHEGKLGSMDERFR